jgi:hypothetical protein
MSLSNFFTARPSLEVGTVSIRVDFGFPLGSETCTTSNISVVSPISLSDIPDIRVGGSENDFLQEKSGGSKVSFPISVEDVEIPITSIGSSEEDLTTKILVWQKY